MAKAKQSNVEEIKHVMKPVTARNEKQKEFLKNLATKQLNIYIGTAGTGKTFLTISQALLWLDRGDIDKIIITRPNVLMGKSIGMLKGSLVEKYGVLVAEMLNVMISYKGSAWVEEAIEAGVVDMCPLEYIRGRNINSLMICDEAQLTNPDEMYTILTRLADGGKMVLLGDPTQKDQKGFDGISWLMDFTKRHNGEEYVGYVESGSDYIERGALCKWAVKGMEQDRESGFVYKGE